MSMSPSLQGGSDGDKPSAADHAFSDGSSNPLRGALDSSGDSLSAHDRAWIRKERNRRKRERRERRDELIKKLKKDGKGTRAIARELVIDPKTFDYEHDHEQEHESKCPN